MASDPTTAPVTSGATRGIAQPVAAPLARTAIFLVVTLNPGPDNRTTLRSFCGDLAALLRAVGFRDIEAGLSCVLGFGSEAWDRLFGPPRPARLHPFREFRAGTRHAVSTPGDLLFHIRAKRMDLCFELATQIMARIGDAASPADEVHGFRYFDDRDLIGFVDGTENPTGQAAIDAVIVGDEDPEFAGGSYVLVQKYLHDLAGWNALSTEASWLRPATEFVQRNREALAARPLWLFSSGPLGPETTDAKGRDLLTVTEPRQFADFRTTLNPRDLRVFFGGLDASRLALPMRLARSAPAAQKAMPEGDFRDWPAIDAWAEDIARELSAAPADRN